MTGFSILDLVAGMIFIFFLLSIICSAIVEMFLTVLKVRAQLLEQWILEIFEDNLGKNIMNHSAVTALSEKDKSPEYIDAKNFTTALLDKITFKKEDAKFIANTIDEFIEAISKSDQLSINLKRQFLMYASEAKEMYGVSQTISQVTLFKTKIENWYDSSMERLIGEIKKKICQKIYIRNCIGNCVFIERR